MQFDLMDTLRDAIATMAGCATTLRRGAFIETSVIADELDRHAGIARMALAERESPRGWSHVEGGPERDPHCDTALDRDARNADALARRPEEL